MLVTFAKKTSGEDIMTCQREDGSVTWCTLWAGFGGEHDLTHYAVESVMGYRHAFFGMVADGRDIDSFGTRNGIRDSYGYEEIWAEFIVGTIQFSGLDGHHITAIQLADALSTAAAEQGVPPPSISDQTLVAIQNRISELVRAWRLLPRGEAMQLVFPPEA